MVILDVPSRAFTINLLITIFILAIVAFALLPELMNSGEAAKANANVTGTQGIFIDLVGLFIMISVALAVFAVSFVIGFKTFRKSNM